MTFRLREVSEGIQTDMDKRDVAVIFVACLARLAADGRETFEVFKKYVTDDLDDSDKGEAQAWLVDLFPAEDEEAEEE